MVSTFAHWHGAEVLAKAIRDIVSEHSDAHFIFIGSGLYKETCEKITQKDKVSDSTTFTGSLSHDEAIATLKACDILVSPHVPNSDGTPFFGSPTKLFEYMAAGKLIVASDLDQVGEILQDKEAAVFTKPGSVSSLVAGINSAITNREKLQKLAKNARMAAETDYTWNANARRAIAEINKIIE
jgi:glycosyltransferase involved in cell wall biosynthesis